MEETSNVEIPSKLDGVSECLMQVQVVIFSCYPNDLHSVFSQQGQLIYQMNDSKFI